MSIFSSDKHDFDMDNPIYDDVEITEKHSLNNETIVKKMRLTGWKCKKCGKVLWLDEWQMRDLPKKQKYGCKEEQAKHSLGENNSK